MTAANCICNNPLCILLTTWKQVGIVTTFKKGGEKRGKNEFVL